MSNALIIQGQMPGYLAAMGSNASLADLNQAAAAGVNAGGWPRLSIRGRQFHFQHPDGQELHHNMLTLDVILVGVNPSGAMSRTYFAKGFDANAEGVAPDCSSDNGIGPSVTAKSPQCGTCAACPWNVLGSKISDNGNSSKACSESKKLAVLIADNTGGHVFELRVPYMSAKNLKVYVDNLTKSGVQAYSIVTRLGFDPATAYPQLTFEPVGYITQEQMQDVMEVGGSDEVKQATGELDKPIDPSRLLAAPQAATPNAGMPPMPQPVMQGAVGGLPPMPQAPMPAMPQQQVYTPQPMPAQAQPSTLSPTQPTVPTPKRTRRTKEQMAASNPQEAQPNVNMQPQQQYVPQPVQQFPQQPMPVQQVMPLQQPVQQQAANTTAPVHVPVIDNQALEAAIAQAMKV